MSKTIKNLLPGRRDGSEERRENEKISFIFNQNSAAKNDDVPLPWYFLFPF